MGTQLYSTSATSQDDAVVIDDDDQLTFTVTAPGDVGGPVGGLNPERLYVAALATCLHQAVIVAASSQDTDSSGSIVRAHARLTRLDEHGYRLQADVDVDLPGAANDEVRDAIIANAMTVCPMTQQIEINRTSIASAT